MVDKPRWEVPDAQQPRPEEVEFDLDRTLIVSNCSFDFCRYLISKKQLSPSALFYSSLYYFRHVFLNMPPSQLHEEVFKRFLKGRSLDALENYVDRFFERYLETSFYLPAIRQLKLAQQLNHYTLILSNSPSFLVKKIAKFLDVCHWKATEYAVDNERKLCHIASIMEGEEKAIHVLNIAKELGLNRSSITAYSDSIWDIELLLAAGTAVVVRPDRKLSARAREHKWRWL